MRPTGAYRKDVTAKRRARGFNKGSPHLGLFLHVFKDVFKDERAPTPVPLTCRPFSLPAGRPVLSPSAPPVSRTLNFSASHRCCPLCTDAKQVRRRPRPMPPCPPRPAAAPLTPAVRQRGTRGTTQKGRGVDVHDRRKRVGREIPLFSPQESLLSD